MPNAILTRAIDALASGSDLSAEETAEVLAEIMHGEVSETQIAGFLIALRTKGETVEELAGLARTMRALAAHVPSEREDLLDTAGTGGGRSTFNVSTTAALIAAGAGCAVAKHGNRSATSRSGSADLLEALGARIDLGPDAVAALHRRGGLRLHVRARAPSGDALRDPGAPRAGGAHDLQPARAADQPGRRPPPADRRLRRRLPRDDRRRAGAARRRPRAGRRRRGRPRRGLGERARRTSSRSTARRSRRYVLDARARSASSSAAGQDAALRGRHARARTRRSRARSCGGAGARSGRAGEALALINAGAAIYAAGGADTIAEGVEAARAALADGRAASALERYVQASQRHAPARAPRMSARRRATVLERILAADARGGRAAQARASAASRGVAGCRARRERGERRFRDALRAPGHRRDRRVQAPLALGGELRERAGRCARSCGAYERGGAVAISVLTEGPNFDGSLEDLRAARAACALPLLRKDFIVDPYQLHEALRGGRRRGAADRGGARRRRSSRRCTSAARALGLDVLVEVHDRAELQRALAARRGDRRDQQPRPARLQRRRRAHRGAAGRCPSRGDGRLGVGDRATPSSCGGCASAACRRCWWASR